MDTSRARHPGAWGGMTEEIMREKRRSKIMSKLPDLLGRARHLGTLAVVVNYLEHPVFIDPDLAMAGAWRRRRRGSNARWGRWRQGWVSEGCMLREWASGGGKRERVHGWETGGRGGGGHLLDAEHGAEHVGVDDVDVDPELVPPVVFPDPVERLELEIGLRPAERTQREREKREKRRTHTHTEIDTERDPHRERDPPPGIGDDIGLQAPLSIQYAWAQSRSGHSARVGRQG